MNRSRAARKTVPTAQANALLEVLRRRFEENPRRHPGIEWSRVHASLLATPGHLATLQEMERTGGEPDWVHDPEAKEYAFFDCSPESPSGRVNLCYDRAALDSRKQNKPPGSAVELAAAMGVSLLTEAQYFMLQRLGVFDAKSSSWIQTPPEVRKLGGGLFCQRRFDRVFVGANGADSYFSSRGFRACLRIKLAA
jgi:hypothetical protein